VSAIPVGALSRPIRSVNVFILVHVGVLPRFEERAPAVWPTGDRSPSGIAFLGHIAKCARIWQPVSRRHNSLCVSIRLAQSRAPQAFGTAARWVSTLNLQAPPWPG
jgi:hypothetical protein